MENLEKINNEEEYKILFEQYCFLVEQEMQKTENDKSQKDHIRVATTLPKLISCVNVIGYLRGQYFLDFRPPVSFQDELFLAEKEFENRLSQLIDYVKNSESVNLYEQTLKEYYLKFRGLDY
ncbi:MAG: hypothetical protein WC446_00950 [Candidatus Paceibacterota bacterium]|jgi:hypothetical protein